MEVAHMTTPQDTPQAGPVQVKHGNIATALASAQMQMGKATKDVENPAFKRDGKAMKYADLSSVMDACMPALNANGIAVIQPTTDDDTGRYVKTVLIHGDSGETLECRVPLIVSKNDMQGYGSAVTYARRYGLMSMAGIAPEDDDGNAAAAAAPKAEAKPALKAETTKAEKNPTSAEIADACQYLKTTQSLDALKAAWGMLDPDVCKVPAVIAAKDARKAELSRPRDAADADSIPY
jgi:hypothetical protein